MPDYYHPDTDQMRKWNVPLPTAETHGTQDDIRANLKPLKAQSWRMEGNKLIGQTDMGELVQSIPTDYICLGIDNRGLPILKHFSEAPKRVAKN